MLLGTANVIVTTHGGCDIVGDGCENQHPGRVPGIDSLNENQIGGDDSFSRIYAGRHRYLEGHASVGSYAIGLSPPMRSDSYVSFD